jgi:hypothetical protein
MTDTDGFWETPHPSCGPHGMGGPTPPSVMRTAWYRWSKPPIRHADRMVWVNCLGIRERRGHSVASPLFQDVEHISSSSGAGTGSSSSHKTCRSRGMLPAPRSASAERRQKRFSRLCAYRKTSVLSLPGKHTAAATTARRRGECGSR